MKLVFAYRNRAVVINKTEKGFEVRVNNLPVFCPEFKLMTEAVEYIKAFIDLDADGGSV